MQKIKTKIEHNHVQMDGINQSVKIKEFIDEFYDKHYKSMLRVCLEKLKMNDIFSDVEDIALDLIEDTILAIIEGRRKVNLSDYNKFKESVYYHLFNRLKDFVNPKKNKHSRKRIISLIDDEGNYSDIADEIKDHFDLTKSIEDKETVEKLKSILSEKELKVFELFVSGFKRKEIAQELSIKPEDVSNIFKRIFRKVKNHNL